MLGDISMPIGQSYDRAHFLRACIEMCTISGGDDWAVVYCEGTGGCSIKNKDRWKKIKRANVYFLLTNY